MQPSTIQDLLDRWVAKSDVVGCSLAIGIGAEVQRFASGYADRETGRTFTPETIVDVRSMAKPVMSAVALRLIEAGTIDLHQPLADHLPSFDNEASRGITVHQCLTHTAGFPKAGYLKPIGQYTSLREAADGLGTHGPIRPPGTRCRYSDASTGVLTAFMQAATGLTGADLVAQHVIEPLGLQATTTQVPDQRDHVASRYGRPTTRWKRTWSADDHRLNIEPPFFRGSGGLWTNVIEYGVFIRAFVDAWYGEGRWLSRPLVQQAFEVVPLSYDNERPNEYGLFWDVIEGAAAKTDPTWSGTHDLVIAHGGTAGTMAAAFVDTRNWVCFASHCQGAEAQTRVVGSVWELLVGSDSLTT